MENKFTKPIIKNFDGDLSKKWHIYYSVFDKVSDKMKYIRDYADLHKIKTVEGRMEAAKKKRNEIEKKLKSGWSPINYTSCSNRLLYRSERILTSRMVDCDTFSGVASHWIDHIQEKLSNETIRTYESKLRLFGLWLREKGRENDPIISIDNDFILEFFDYIINEKELSGNSVRKYKDALYNVWEFARKLGYIYVNAINAIPECSRINDKTAYPLTVSETKMLFNEINGDMTLELACKFEFYCFLRPGKEIRLMQISWIDFERGIINVPMDVVKNTNPKNRKSKHPTIPDVFLNELKYKWNLRSYPPNFYVLGNHGTPGTTPYGKNTLKIRFQKIRKKLGFPENIKLYSLKHTGNAVLADAGVSLYAIKEQNGHNSIATTERYLKNKVVTVNNAIKRAFDNNI
ncbi:MAG: tyrosine-type recombinase/integrase [Bacteroidales bacterium]|nr:tyrosine-type recombinase/integrase [Bacteroidales bacterium]